MKELNNIIEILKVIRQKLDLDTDIMWTHYESPSVLIKEFDTDFQLLITGDLEKLNVFRNHFLPTGLFQELSLSNGWEDEYIELATLFDQSYTIINSKNSTNTLLAKIKNFF
jgi:hypothetical protein